MFAAIGWGALAASSLVLGALLAIGRTWSDRSVGLVLSFGAGALISAVSFELFEKGVEDAGGVPVGVGLALGALAYFAADRPIERRPTTDGGGLALGALLDGIPEQLVLGIMLAASDSITVGLLVAVFVSNLPEAIGSSSDMLAAQHSRRRVVGLWTGVALVCLLATIVGYGVADSVGAELRGVVNGFAAGALLVMLAGTMIPEARSKAGPTGGLALVLGFAVATVIS